MIDSTQPELGFELTPEVDNNLPPAWRMVIERAEWDIQSVKRLENGYFEVTIIHRSALPNAEPAKGMGKRGFQIVGCCVTLDPNSKDPLAPVRELNK